MDATILAELGECAAVGFYEAVDQPWPAAYGRAYRRLYENMEIRVPDGRMLIPAESLPRAKNWRSHNVWTATALILDHDHSCGLRFNESIAEEKKEQFPQHAAFIDELLADLRSRLAYFGGYTHSNPDMRRVVGEGFDSIHAELTGEIAKVRAEGDAAEEGALELLLAVEDFAFGVRAFYDRTREAVAAAAAEASGERAAELAQIGEALGQCFMQPSKTFYQGLLAVNLAWMIDGCDSIGRLDQVLGDLYDADLAEGRLEKAFGQRLLDEVFDNFEIFNGWNLQIGGWTPEDTDGTNALTLAFIAACGRNHFRRPNVAFRITSETPDSAVVEALRALRGGSGRPALYNDDLYVKTLREMDLGLSHADATEVGFGGCTETMIAGLSNVGSLEGEINLAKALELALNDGFDPHAGEVRGPRTGRFEEMDSFEQFLAAVKRQLQFRTAEYYAWDREQLTKRFTQGDPKMARTLFTRDCIPRRKSFEAGGARYNWCVVSYQGIANLIDSLAAIRQCVYEDGTMTQSDLLAALVADFEGCENIRQALLAAPKFGNDDDRVDLLGREIIEYAWSELYSYQPPRGGRYLASCILFVTYSWAGQPVGATPDGRRAGEPLADSVGAFQGNDIHGPTALLNSVAKLPLHLAVGTPVLNIRLQRAIMDSDEDLGKIASLIRAYFAKGGLQIQVSVLNKAELLAAQAEPEKHADLLVRIGGYSEYFCNLSPELQETVIARTDHGL
ncbi:MAG: pyruvate formate lyase family protein [Planctomycetota bacterium]|jgi:formate C-acetyltransferase